MISATWRVSSGSTFRWRQWDDEVVLYHDESGDTHRLNALSARALEHLGRAALASGELTERLASEFEVDADAAFASSIEQLLARLHELGLIERVDDTRETQPV